MINLRTAARASLGMNTSDWWEHQLPGRPWSVMVHHLESLGASPAQGVMASVSLFTERVESVQQAEKVGISWEPLYM